MSPGAAAVSATGRILWLCARGSGAVYALSTRTGRAVRQVALGARPRGLSLHPQPGRFSLGHTGDYR